ncbi:MAG: GerAB/ArcD/ProY family transporter [Clostridiaceae bacterium]|nr:spore germination protein [Eubacteriales bacterium]
MRNTVTNRQVVFILFITLSTSSVATVAKTMAVSAGHGAWLTLLLVSIIFGLIATVIVKLNRLHEGKTLYQYSRELVGKYAAFAIGLIYLAYFFLFSLQLCNTFNQIIKSGFLLKTPVWAMLLAGMPIYGIIAYRGIRNIGRLAEIVGLTFLVVAIILFVSMLFQGTFSFVLPLYYPPDTGKYLLSLKDAIEPFLGVEVLLLIPFTKKSKKLSMTAMLSILGMGLFYILDVYGCYAMIGMDEIVYHKFPLVDAIRLVEYPQIEFLQRLDIVYDTIGFMRVFVGKSMLYLMIVELLSKMLPKANRLILVIVVGAAIFFASFMTSQLPDILRTVTSILSMGGIAVVFVIPLLLLLITKVKKHEENSG